VTETFEFEVPVYSKGIVIRLLQRYLDIRLSLIDRMPKQDKAIYSSQQHQYREKPLGASANTGWPFMQKPNAQPRMDGKRKARMMEDLHCATIDLENALLTLTPDEYKLIAEYYIYGSVTLDELAEARGLTSKGRLHDRIMRIVAKLVRRMNEGGT
jgi:hypothetical protein